MSFGRLSNCTKNQLKPFGIKLYEHMYEHTQICVCGKACIRIETNVILFPMLQPWNVLSFNIADALSSSVRYANGSPQKST